MKILTNYEKKKEKLIQLKRSSTAHRNIFLFFDWIDVKRRGRVAISIRSLQETLRKLFQFR